MYDYQAVGPSRGKFNPTMLSFDDERWKKFLGGYRTESRVQRPRKRGVA